MTPTEKNYRNRDLEIELNAKNARDRLNMFINICEWGFYGGMSLGFIWLAFLLIKQIFEL